MRRIRLNEMNKYIAENSAASYEELCSKFNISINTARRDVETLVAEGTVVKTYGGVAVNQSAGLVSYKERHIYNVSEKKKIAKAAAELICDGDVIFLDSGTTVPLIMDHIGDKHITIITASIDVLLKGYENPNIEIYCLSGKLNRDTNSFQEIGIAKYLSNYNITKAFMAASGCSISGGVTTSASWEFQTKKAVVSKESMKILVLDNSKMEKIQLFKFADLKDFDYIVSNKIDESKYLDFFKENDVKYLAAT